MSKNVIQSLKELASSVGFRVFIETGGLIILVKNSDVQKDPRPCFTTHDFAVANVFLNNLL